MLIYLLHNTVGVEKKNDMAKILYYRKSNKWDYTVDLIQMDYTLHKLRDYELPNRTYR